jgi:AcrR family transcriptional regulator
MSRREDNRKRRHTAMLDAAVALFDEKGFAATRLEDVARRADVSPATLYNYFPTKGHLIGELYRDDLIRIHNEQDKIIESPPECPVDAVFNMLQIEVEDGYIFIDRMVWREIYSTAIGFTDETIEVVNPLNETRTRQHLKLLEKLQSLGKISASADIHSLADVFSCLNEAHFLSRLIKTDVPNGEILARLKKNVKAVLTNCT